MHKSPKRGESLIELMERFDTKDKCLDFLEKLRWNGKVACPRCKCESISRITTRRIFECNACRYQFSITAGTIFHKTRLPLRKWIIAVVMMCNGKKGVSAKEIERALRVTYKTAWYLCHRIRRAFRENGFIKKFTGICEVDETYIGGKPRRKNIGSRLLYGMKKAKRGRGTKKQMVVGVRERGGFIHVELGKDTSSKTLCSIVRKHVDKDCEMLCTDELPSYGQLANDYRREKVNHLHQYVRGQVHVNSVETFWAILKRGFMGTFHRVSVKYLSEYLNEFTFRFNHARNSNGVGLWKKVLANGLIYDGG